MRSITLTCCVSMLLIESGCTPLHTGKRSADYQTVSADISRDLQAAVRLHEKGLKLLEAPPVHPKRLAKAEKHFRDSLAADVTYGPAHNSLGVVYFLQKRRYLAAWEFELAAKTMPERGEALNNLGLVYESVGKHEDAIAAYQQAHAVEPRNAQFLGNLIRARLRRGDEVESVQPQLSDLVLLDDRPNWVAWGREKLALAGLAVLPSASAEEFIAEAPLPALLAPGEPPVPSEVLPLPSPVPSPIDSATEDPMELLLPPI